MVKPLSALASARLPTKYGSFTLYLYQEEGAKAEHLALVSSSFDPSLAAIKHNPTSGVVVRIHSECMTGDVFGSQRCDCGDQLAHGLEVAHLEGGIVLYLRQEGRGIGLLEKLKAYRLQDQGYDTIEANELLGHQADERDYQIAARILLSFGVCKVRLITNNPNKIASLTDFGIEVVERIPSQGATNPENHKYMETKRQRFAHLLPEEIIDDETQNFGTPAK